MQTMSFHYSTTDANCPMEGQSDNLFFCSDKRFFLNFVVVFSCFYPFLIYTIEFVSFSSKTALTTLFRHVLT